MGFTSNLSFVRKNPALTAVATITLSAGVIYTLVSGANNNTIIQQWKTVDGRGQAHITSSGSIVGSGNTLFADQKTGSGRILCAGTDGCALVLNDADGAGCWAIEVNNGTLITHGVPASECP